ncbi:MAG: type II secretion system protein [Phycisphaerae bacterium]
MNRRSRSYGFTLVELLVTIAIITALAGILLPSLAAARQQGHAAKCLAQLRGLGQGLVMYTMEHGGILVPGRLPKIDDANWAAEIAGGLKYRPTFLAMMGSNIGTAPFDDPMARKSLIDRFGEQGDRQNYSRRIFVCPTVPDWTDERNGSYGYNYQFLGNSRLSDPSDLSSFKNWPVAVTRLGDTAQTVAVGDCVGTAASFPIAERGEYVNNARDGFRPGNEGFNLDPPRVDPAAGEMAGFSHGERSAADPRHRGRTNILWVDGHGSSESLQTLGYQVAADGVVSVVGNNALWSGTGRDVAWLSE